MDNQINCPNCGHPRESQDRFCKNCGKPFEEPAAEASSTGGPAGQPEVPAAVPPPTETRYVAWEDRQKLGFFQALWETWKESVFYPNKFFSRMPFTGGLGSPILYALVLGWPIFAIAQLTGFLMSSFWMSLLSNFIPESEMLIGRAFQAWITLLYIAIAPFFIVLGLLIVAGIYHLLFMIFGWANRNFEATFRATAYSYGPLVFSIVPACGGLVGFIWAIVLLITGFKHMQRTTGGKAALVFFIPLILCCCLMLFLGLLFGTALLALIRSSYSGSGAY